MPACFAGRIEEVGPTTLVDGHEDGKVGDVFVLEFNKSRVNKRKPLNEQKVF